MRTSPRFVTLSNGPERVREVFRAPAAAVAVAAVARPAETEAERRGREEGPAPPMVDDPAPAASCLFGATICCVHDPQISKVGACPKRTAQLVLWFMIHANIQLVAKYETDKFQGRVTDKWERVWRVGDTPPGKAPGHCSFRPLLPGSA